jgi:DNA polymerase-3 subunit alpha
MVDDFIDRKHGRKEIAYDLPELKEVLEETYGVIVYQEQVMQISNLLAGYSLGEADILRRAMGKKKPRRWPPSANDSSRREAKGFRTRKVVKFST